MLTIPSDTPSGPVCGVVAVAMAASVPFSTAWDTIKTIAGKSGNWRGRTHHHHRVEALARLGVSFKHVEVLRRMTLKTFIENHTVRGVTYKVNVTGHVVTVFNNAVADQFGVLNYLLHRSARQMVRAVLEIETSKEN